MTPGAALVQLPQDRETPVQAGGDEWGWWQYAYARAAETQQAGDPGQDYLTFAHAGGRFCFALCDGVSQSFFGDIAARTLGDALVAWLWDRLPVPMDVAQIGRELGAYLHELTAAGHGAVQAFPLPARLPAYLRDVLEQKRQQGSEAMFVGGLIDLPGEAFPDGQLLAAWMGDSRLRMWGPDGECSDRLGRCFHTYQRWSTHRGLLGAAPHLFCTPLRQHGQPVITKLAVYSDGLSVLDRRDYLPVGRELQELIAFTGQSPASDDVSFLAVHLTPERRDEGDGSGHRDSEAS